HKVEDDFAVIVPAGARHNVINTGDSPLKLYTLYGPPEHRLDVVHPDKPDAESDEEHFDGRTTESPTRVTPDSRPPPAVVVYSPANAGRSLAPRTPAATDHRHRVVHRDDGLHGDHHLAAGDRSRVRSGAGLAQTGAD